MTVFETIRFLQKNDRYLLLTHRRPDGDTLGSAAALCIALRQLGKTAFVLDNPEVSLRLSPYIDELRPDFGYLPDCIVSLDTASLSLFPATYAPYFDKIALRIDHHGTGSCYAENELVLPDRAATGEVVMELLKGLGCNISPQIADALYLAISTDTGCFRYSNTSSITLRLVAELLDAGAAAARINRVMFDTKSLRRLNLESMIYDDIDVRCGGLVAICRLTLDMIARTRATDDDVEGLSAIPRQIEGVEIGILIREEQPGLCKASLRTGESYDASRICMRLGGGGHPRASGCMIEGNVEHAAAELARVIKEEYPDVERHPVYR